MNKGIVAENQRKGYMPFIPTNSKGRSFKRMSKGAIIRQARRYLYRKSGAAQLILV